MSYSEEDWNKWYAQAPEEFYDSEEWDEDEGSSETDGGESDSNDSKSDKDSSNSSSGSDSSDDDKKKKKKKNGKSKRKRKLPKIPTFDGEGGNYYQWVLEILAWVKRAALRLSMGEVIEKVYFEALSAKTRKVLGSVDNYKKV